MGSMGSTNEAAMKAKPKKVTPLRVKPTSFGDRPRKAGPKSGAPGRRNLRHTVEAPGVTYVRVLPENKAEERARELQAATGARWRNKQ